MILYYAAGGGLGHLTRATALLGRLEPGRPAALLTASPFARDPRVTGGLPVVAIPRELEADLPAYRAWLEALLASGDYDALYVDSFPGGILGELCGPAALGGLTLRHAARRLKWAAYERRLAGALPRYERTYVLEPLEQPHADALADCSTQVEALTLAPPQPGPAPDGPWPGDRPLWVVVHSGSREEVADLVAYADDQRRLEGSPAHLLVVSPDPPDELPPGASTVDLYPASDLYPAADRIFTACGFNCMREAEPYRDRHRFVPYERALDDQHARAAGARPWRPAAEPG